MNSHQNVRARGGPLETQTSVSAASAQCPGHMTKVAVVNIKKALYTCRIPWIFSHRGLTFSGVVLKKTSGMGCSSVHLRDIDSSESKTLRLPESKVAMLAVTIGVEPKTWTQLRLGAVSFVGGSAMMRDTMNQVHDGR